MLNAMIYFGYEAGKKDVSDMLKKRNLLLLRTRPSDFQVSVAVNEHLPLYGQYIHSLHAAMRATRTGEPVDIRTQACFPVKRYDNADDLLPLTLPNLCVAFPKMSEDILARMSFNRAVEFSKTGKSGRGFIIPKPDEDLFAWLRTVELADTKAPMESVSLSEMRVFRSVLNNLSCLFQTHTYPAFQDDTHVETLVRMKRAQAYSWHMEEVKRLRLTETPQVRATSSSPQGLVEDDTAMEVENIEAKAIQEKGSDDEQDTSTLSLQGMSSIVMKRIKPNKEPRKMWGLPEQIPMMPGLFFVYDPDVAKYDTDGVPAFLDRWLTYTLGGTVESSLEVLESIRKAWRSIGNTEQGNHMAHLCKCMHIALEAQATCFAVFQKSTYMGCVVQGVGFRVSIQGVLHSPQHHTILLEAVIKSSPHEMSLQKIASLVDNAHMCKTIRQLSKLCQHVDLTPEQKKEIYDMIYLLRFPDEETYWGMNVTTLTKMITMLRSYESIQEIGNDVPLYPSMFWSTEVVDSVLAAFGSEAPTFDLAGCAKHEVSVKSVSPVRFHFARTPLPAAAKNWKLAMINRYIKNNPVGKASSHQWRPLTGSDKLEVYGELVKLFNPSSEFILDRIGKPDESKQEENQELVVERSIFDDY